MSAYKRVLLKISGEALMGDDSFGINVSTLRRIAADVATINRLGIELALVIGGGNIFRGTVANEQGMDRATGDYMGMLATVMNCLAFSNALKNQGVVSRVMSAIDIQQIAEPYVRPKALQYLEEKKVVIFAAGTGNPFFTTDTAAALRATEIDADIVLKATKVDGIYDSDPNKNPSAKRYLNINFSDVLNQKLEVMDSTAFALCRDQNMPIRVFSIIKPNSLIRLIEGEEEGTLVDNKVTSFR